MEAAAPSTGDSVKDSSKLGVDEQERPWVATLPNRKGGSVFSALVGRCRKQPAERPFRARVGRVTGRRRLHRWFSRGRGGVGRG